MILSGAQKTFSGVYVQDPEFFGAIYGAQEQAEIGRKVNILGELVHPGQTAARAHDLAQADFLFTGWGAPDFKKLLPLMPQVKAIFYAGGATKSLIDPALWERGIQLTSAYAANAVPVAEFTLAALILGLKRAWLTMMDIKREHCYERPPETTGAYRSTVGLVSCGAIARELLRLLKAFDLKVLVYDPHLSGAEIAALGAEAAGLDEIFSLCDVVSIHTPELEETRGMIGPRQFARMKPYATFINTARGAIVQEEALCETARQRPDLQFVLDVVSVEPPPAGSPLYTLPNVILTPHLAGAMGGECRRLGRTMVEELDRYLAGGPLRWEITPDLAAISSHRPPFMAPPESVEIPASRTHPGLASC